ncbi:MAG: triacylglycerol lipase [Clostridiales bacterium]|nr:triacylglycerol lipase [Clostridiales bacterium]
MLIRFDKRFWIPALICFALAFVLPVFCAGGFPGKKLKGCYYGLKMILMFLVSTCVSVIVFTLTMVYIGKEGFFSWWPALVIPYTAELFYFWVGIIVVYVNSKQLGLKYRLIGLLCGMIPIAHLFALGMIIKKVDYEVKLEYAKNKLDLARQKEQVCRTRYPILMVHGVFFRDFDHFNYWGRTPKELERNGAKIFYGEHESASPVPVSAQQIADKVMQIIREENCGKVNIIAHSKGGLDTRYAVSMLGIAPYVASITTVNTPHRGCEFADYLLGKAPQKLRESVAAGYNAALRKIGDLHPDFISAVTDLTASKCQELNNVMNGFDMKAHGIYTQSIGSVLFRSQGGRFPLNMSYMLVKAFDGKNDGLVGEGSFQWGEKFTFIEPDNKRGVSHGDIIDLNRENIPGFDVREFFVELVSDLKNRGL